MNKEELMITKEDLVNWLNRLPNNDDLDLIGFITTRLENFYKLQQENKQLKDNWNKLKEIAKSQSGFKKRANLKGGVWFEIDELLDKMKELEQGSDSNE